MGDSDRTLDDFSGFAISRFFMMIPDFGKSIALRASGIGLAGDSDRTLDDFGDLGRIRGILRFCDFSRFRQMDQTAGGWNWTAGDSDRSLDDFGVFYDFAIFHDFRDFGKLIGPPGCGIRLRVTRSDLGRFWGVLRFCDLARFL